MIGVSEEKLREGWFRVHGCPVSVTVGWRNIEIVIHGSLSVETATTFADAVRAKLEAAIRQKCVLEML